MAIIANPIYDVVFKFMMEDDKVAKILLSALLQKEVIELTMRRNEYTAMQQSRISLFRIDFSATVRNADGTDTMILIELQKTWLTTETLRFRQYLGTQYLNKENIPERNVNPKGFGIPIVSIYILGHKLGELTEPVVYVRRQYLDYDAHQITEGVPDGFIESLTHDSIIVQIPYLKGRLRNRLERLLNVFDQDYCLKGDEHLMNIEMDETGLSKDEHLLINRLQRAVASPEVRRAMEVEDEILSEIEERDTTIMMKKQEIEEQQQEIEQKKQVIEQKKQVIEEKKQVIEQKEQVIEEKKQEIEQKEQVIEQKEQVIGSMVKMLCRNGVSPNEISRQLSIPLEQIEQYIHS